jgi:Domain of unknown function (DUF4082)/Bacterial Ig-like domain (group 3)/Bacterial Ig-like domain/Bacterial Ig domain
MPELTADRHVLTQEYDGMTRIRTDVRRLSNSRHNSRVDRTRRRPRIELLEDRTLLAVNPIVAENQLPGTPESVWQVNGAGDTTLQGFSTDISVNEGQTVYFKINDSSLVSYHIDIYRMGYYGGDGARLVTTIPASQIVEIAQPAPLSDPTTGLVDAGNWSVSASWAVPATATSGIYMARLTRNDNGNGSLIYFVVRDDASTSDILFQTSDSTWQAYNTWGGNSLYQGNSQVASGRAVKVSYNRPLIDDGVYGGFGNYNSPLHAEYPMVRWLEENGYDVTYFTDVDSDRYGNLIKNHKVFLSVGHDEYWSAGQRNNVEAARDAGVNLAFFSGDECYWKTRWENSTDGSGTSYRTLVCYKESTNGVPLDPLDSSPTWTWTGTWRDNRYSPPADGGKPENALSGTAYMDDATSSDTGISLNVPASDANLRFWRNTSVANLAPGQVATLGQYVVGYEVNEDLDNGFRPAGLIDMSSTTFNTPLRVQVPWGTDVGPGTSTHSITLYRAASGALVFSAGTIQWSWGLDGDNNIVPVTPDPAMQQATVNLLADMGVQPGTLQPGMVPATKSTDTTPPTSKITSPIGGANIQSGSTVTITGTATDAGGGVVAGVEVSVDGGVTWHPAVGRSSWTYTWSPNQNGNATILSRAVDDSGNIETPSAGVTVSVQGPISLWSNSTVPGIISVQDANSIELGVKFQSSTNGYILGLRFYKGPSNTGTHVGSLWSSNGTLLAQATFTSESATGWQQVLFSTPVAIAANTTYVASYHTNTGYYSADDRYFANGGFSNGPLHALADGVAGANGIYSYSSTSIFPSNAYRSQNYYVDVVFGTTGASNIPPTVTSHTPASGATGVALGSTVTATFSEPVTNGSIVFTLTGPGGSVPATLTYDAGASVATLTPNSPLATSTTYTAAVSGAVDAAGNVMAPISWTFTTASSASFNGVSIWSSTATPSVASFNDPNPYELGVKFQATVNGYITGIRFYKGSGNTGTHIGNLWTSTGTLLATATFTSETATGWQQVLFSSPVAITANTTYVASYHTNAGDYALDAGYFASNGVSNGPLIALSNSAGGGNGVYAAGASAFPTNTYNSNNYWVDVVFTQTLGQTTTALASSVNPSTAGQSVTFTATVAPTSGGGTPTGQVTFMDGATTLGTGTLSGGVATFTTSALSAGTRSITAVYNGDSNYGGSTSAVLSQVVNQGSTSVALASSANPSTFGQSVTFTATLTVASGGTPTGQVTFMDGTTTLGTGALSGGVATFSTTTLSTGTHSITAVYNGDGNFGGGVSSALSQVVNQGSTSFNGVSIWSSTVTPSVTSFNDPNAYELGVKFQATVNGYITGIRFYKGSGNTGTHIGNLWTSTGTLLATATFTSETATGWQQVLFSTPVAITANTTYVASYHTNAGDYALDAAYFASNGVSNGPLVALSNSAGGGNGVYAAGASAFPRNTYNSNNYWVDVVFSQTLGQSTTTALASSANPSASGQSLTFTATVAPSSGSGTPTGQVTFMDGTTTLGTGTLSGGVATFTISTLSVATHSITAVYSGDTTFRTSTSSAVKEVVNLRTTTTTLASSANPSTFGQSLTFTATVTAAAGGTPTGLVTFMDGTATLGTGTLSGGVATFTTSTLSAGIHTIKAVYGGDANFKTSTSGTVKEMINQSSMVASVAPLAQSMLAPIVTGAVDTADAVTAETVAALAPAPTTVSVPGVKSVGPITGTSSVVLGSQSSNARTTVAMDPAALAASIPLSPYRRFVSSTGAVRKATWGSLS